MVHQDSLLVTLAKLVDRIPVPPPPAKLGLGRPMFYPDRLLLKALVLIIIRHYSSIDIEAHWTRPGWRGWVYGWKLHLITTVATVWIPLAAQLTPANEADNELAFALIQRLSADLCYLLCDIRYNAPNVRQA